MWPFQRRPLKRSRNTEENHLCPRVSVFIPCYVKTRSVSPETADSFGQLTKVEKSCGLFLQYGKF